MPRTTNAPAGSTRSFIAALAAIVLVLGGQAGAQEADGRFMLESRDLATIEAALATERPAAPPPASVTGVTVPHHMLAADLIARGIWAASSGSYERVLIIAPDHFRTLSTPFGVTTAGFEPATGAVEPDPAFSQALLRHPALFSDTGTAAAEHGVHSVVPFVRAVFPQAKVVAVTASITSGIDAWEHAAGILAGLVGPETLIVQSTDYSHHLPRRIAVLRDQETLAAIASGNADAIAALHQPAHLDTLAAQFIQMRLQDAVYGAAPVIVANRNSADYAGNDDRTTSYVVTVFTNEPADGSAFQYPDHEIVWFAGDVLAGRGFTDLLQHEGARAAIVDPVLARTRGLPLIVNLEGVLLDDRPAGANTMQLSMTERLTIPLLRDLGVVAASLANNHAWDFGEAGLAETRSRLASAGIAPLEHGTVAEAGPFRVLPLTFKRSYFNRHPVISGLDGLAQACAPDAPPPLVVFAHWGDDYVDRPGAFEHAALATLAACGVTALIGAHSHKASFAVDAVAGGAMQSVFSLGNFVFDQRGDTVSSMLVEARTFVQGTVALRPVALPNLFEAALAARAGERADPR